MVTDMILDESSVPLDSASYQKFVRDYLEDTPVKPNIQVKSELRQNRKDYDDQSHFNNGKGAFILPGKSSHGLETRIFNTDPDLKSLVESNNGPHRFSESEFSYEEDESENGDVLARYQGYADDGPILDEEFQRMVDQLDEENEISHYPHNNDHNRALPHTAGDTTSLRRSINLDDESSHVPIQIEEPTTYHVQLKDEDLEELDIPDMIDQSDEELDELTPSHHFPHISRIEGFTTLTLEDTMDEPSPQTSGKDAPRNSTSAKADINSDMMREVHTPFVEGDDDTTIEGDDDGPKSSQPPSGLDTFDNTPTRSSDVIQSLSHESHRGTIKRSGELTEMVRKPSIPQFTHSSFMGSPSASSSVHEMLTATINECQSLRNLNETLLNRNKDLEKQVEKLSLEKDKEVLETRNSMERRIQKLKDAFDSQKSEFQDRIKELEDTLDEAKSARLQMGSLRQSLQREQDLTLLTIKKELLAQKEKQLYELRREMGIQKEQMVRDLEEEHAAIRSRIEKERDAYKEKLNSSETLIHELQQQLEVALAPKQIDHADIAIQVNESTPEERDLKSKEIELGYIKEQLFLLFSDSSSNRHDQSSSEASDRLKLSQSLDNLPTTAKLLEMCRGHIERTEHASIRLRLDLENKQEQLASQERMFSDRLHSEKESLEFQHQKEISSLRRAQATEKEMLKSSFESQLQLAQNDSRLRINELEARIDEQKKFYEEKLARLAISQTTSSSSQSNDFSRSLTIRDLLARYPMQLGAYRSSIEATLNKQMNEREAEQKQHLDRIVQEHTLTIQELKNRADAQKQALVDKHNNDIRELSVKLKDQCAVAYEKAITKLKGEYTKLEKQLVQRYESRERELMSETNRGNEKFKEIDVLKSKIEEYSQKLRQAENELKMIKEKNSNELSMIKEKYIATLKKMRDDLAANKKASWERLELEWVKRKKVLNEEWIKRLEGIKEHCHAFHGKCHCPNLVTWSLDEKKVQRHGGIKYETVHSSSLSSSTRKLPDPFDWEKPQ